MKKEVAPRSNIHSGTHGEVLQYASQTQEFNMCQYGCDISY